jgi:hypothetical protein
MSENLIEQKRAELAQLEAKERYFKSLPESYQLAERLHTLLCNWNHCDGCSWYYTSWEKYNGAFSDPTRGDYVRKAEKLIEAAKRRGVDPSDLLDIFNEIKSL